MILFIQFNVALKKSKKYLILIAQFSLLAKISTVSIIRVMFIVYSLNCDIGFLFKHLAVRDREKWSMLNFSKVKNEYLICDRAAAAAVRQAETNARILIQK